jgi:PBP1b-binding outer membrane lipoprotein LpoB
MRRKSLLAILAILLLVGCAGISNLPPEVKPFAVYQKSLEVFNGNLRTYLDTRMIMPPEVQAEWKVKIEPTIDQASNALDAWGLVLAQGLDDAVAKADYNRLFTQMLALLMKYNVVEVK